MIVLRGDHRTWTATSSTAITVGVYDGVHRGHQHVLHTLKTTREMPLAVVTFAAHPAAVVNPARAPRLLTSLPHRLELLEEHGVDICAVLDFDDRMRRMSAAEFVGQVLVGALDVSVVSVGEDFRFGFELQGDVDLLRGLGESHGFEVTGLPLLADEEPIRSTTIRAALGAGDVERAAHFLGRPFQLRGEVLRGDQRGRAIGFPTANLEPPHALARPRWGVYTAWAGVDVPERPAVVNVGVRPTIGGERELVEVHLLDGEADLYGAELRVDFVSRLRDELQFPTLDALVAQIGRDAAAARQQLVDAGRPS